MLACVFGIAVYRAKTQTIAHDEALEYEWFLDGGAAPRPLLQSRQSHLFTLLAKPIVWSLGNREIILRSPSLLGTAIYLLATICSAVRLFEGPSFFSLVALLALNPQILDFMAAARGYILGLAFLATAMYFMARLAERGKLLLPTRIQMRWEILALSDYRCDRSATEFRYAAPWLFGQCHARAERMMCHERHRRERMDMQGNHTFGIRSRQGEFSSLRQTGHEVHGSC